MNNLVVHLRRFNVVSSWLTEKIRCYFYSLCSGFQCAMLAVCLHSTFVTRFTWFTYIQQFAMRIRFIQPHFQADCAMKVANKRKPKTWNEYTYFKKMMNKKKKHNSQRERNGNKVYREGCTCSMFMVRCLRFQHCNLKISALEIRTLEIAHLSTSYGVFSVSLSVTSSFVAQNNHKIASKKKLQTMRISPNSQWIVVVGLFLFSFLTTTSVSHFIITLFWDFNLITTNNERKKESQPTNYILVSFSNESVAKIGNRMNETKRRSTIKSANK